MKKSLFIILMLLIGFTAGAQRFEWAKGFTSGYEDSFVKGSLTDSVGNLYILAFCGTDARWDGRMLVPSEVRGRQPSECMMLIAKITPEGDMDWKKVVVNNNGIHSSPHDIKPVGDSAFACIFDLELPYSSVYCYYLDTFMFSWNDYPIPNIDGGWHFCTAVVVFDFDGNILEQHFLQVSYMNRSGRDYTMDVPLLGEKTVRYNLGGISKSFDFDEGGNVYIAREACDYIYPDSIDVENGTIEGIKFWVDNRVAGEIHLGVNRPKRWYPQILKFSPHFDTLLAYRYVIEQSDMDITNHWNIHLKMRNDGSLFFLDFFSPPHHWEHDEVLHVGGSENLSFLVRSQNIYKSFLVKYDSSLMPQYVVDIQDSVSGSDFYSISNFYDVDFEEDSGLVILEGIAAGRPFHYGSHDSVLHILLGSLMKPANGVFVAVFRDYDNQPELNSYARVPMSQFGSNGWMARHLLYNKNRVYVQCLFNDSIQLPGETVVLPPDPNYFWGQALVVFDLQGNVIDGMLIDSSATGNDPLQPAIHDSILYLVNVLHSDAYFGDIHVTFNPMDADNITCFAKYVDSSLMQPAPYRPRDNDTTVGPVDTTHHGISSVAPSALLDPSVYPNPAHERVTLTLAAPAPAGSTLTLLDIYGRTVATLPLPAAQTRLPLDLRSLPPATYLLRIHTPAGTTTKKLFVR